MGVRSLEAPRLNAMPASSALDGDNSVIYGSLRRVFLPASPHFISHPAAPSERNPFQPSASDNCRPTPRDCRLVSAPTACESHQMPPSQKDADAEVTAILNEMRAGNASADDLIRAVYTELRKLAAAKMAREPAGHTLQATALVHEAWLRLGNVQFENRSHFFGAAAEAMRRILVDRARRKGALKNGSGAEHRDIEDLEIAAPLGNDDEILALHEALDRLAAYDPRKADLVKLRYFTGLSIEEAAEVLGISERTAARDWDFARAWLHREIRMT
jgi:RNA polymerase sigma factor (TIGR02999 family)